MLTQSQFGNTRQKLSAPAKCIFLKWDQQDSNPSATLGVLSYKDIGFMMTFSKFLKKKLINRELELLPSGASVHHSNLQLILPSYLLQNAFWLEGMLQR